MITINNEKIPKSPQYECSCGKVYKYRQGLHIHRKSCNYKEPTQNNDNNQQFQIILELIKDNKEIKDFLIEQNKQLLKLSTTQIGNNNDINSHNKISNKFNINMFLNEKCKDALNIY